MKRRVLIADRYGQPDVLAIVEQDLGPLAAGLVRIAVKSAGVNPIDARRMTGEVKFGRLPLTFGTEFAGTIVELPIGAERWSAGDEVLGSGGAFVTHATIIDVPTGNLIRRPPSMDWSVAGSLAGVAQTAMAVLQEFDGIKTLLVNGGAGGVGTVLIQLAREKGIEVVATASEANLAYLRSLGATPVAYGPGLSERISREHPAAFDAAIILGGTEEATAASLATVKPGGDIASITGVPAPSDRVRATGSKPSTTNLQYVVDRVADGRIKWEVSQTYPFVEAAKAYLDILQGHTRGKRVLVF
jgi:NADPH:quinone reductase-like Zn-dependent oxidoreductase